MIQATIKTVSDDEILAFGSTYPHFNERQIAFQLGITPARVVAVLARRREQRGGRAVLPHYPAAHAAS